MSDASTFVLFLRVGFSLAIVLGLIWFAARVAKRRGAVAAKQSDMAIDVVARRSVGRRGSLVVVESAGRRLLVGVTDERIELVADLSAGELPPAEPRPDAVDRNVTVVATAVDAAPLPTRASAPVERLPVSVDGDESVAPRRESLVDHLRDLTVRR